MLQRSPLDRARQCHPIARLAASAIDFINTEKPEKRGRYKSEEGMAGSTRRNIRTVPMEVLSLAMPRTGTMSTSVQYVFLLFNLHDERSLLEGKSRCGETLSD